jgi:hypothetical protein
MTRITKYKVIATGMALISLLPANQSIFDRVRTLTIFTRDHMSALLSIERAYTIAIYFLTPSLFDEVPNSVRGGEETVDHLGQVELYFIDRTTS